MLNLDSAVADFDLVCFSHLRWDFVYQRPQHLLSRFAKQRRVFFIEEPMLTDDPSFMDISAREDKLFVVVPQLNKAEAEATSTDELIRSLLDKTFREENINNYVFWYYTPMALSFSEHFKPRATVYDCMDELSLFKFAPPTLLSNEEKLFAKSDVVFTGGQSLYEAKRTRHKNIWAFPSSIDVAHFKKARTISEDVADQSNIPHPRLGFIGVIDERIDLELLRRTAEMRPDWHFVMIGPVVKISESDLPQAENIHYLGKKDYNELPSYISGWDAALMPFAINDSTRFISPTKTPEFLAAGKPVVSTAIRDVVRPYGEKGLVQIATSAEEFVAAAEKALTENRAERLEKVDRFLLQTSWDNTWRAMTELVSEVAVKRAAVS
ncbi:MAG TPA: glycosyltransferase family 1 protein [Pyrinomonadaceae bacterium]|nr:glycosyltransferase family 1 protein [Pyrinomonadaceae bacterium]